MNWIERLYEIKNKDLYAQNGEGLILEYIFSQLRTEDKTAVDIGGGDGFYLSNTRHLKNLGCSVDVIDKENGHTLTLENFDDMMDGFEYNLFSVDTDGNDYWFIEKILG